MVTVAAWRRCPTCDRWGGARRLDESGTQVEIGDDDGNDEVRGLCNGGPWHDSLRGPRNACGRWLCWQAVVAGPASPDDRQD